MENAFLLLAGFGLMLVVLLFAHGFVFPMAWFAFMLVIFAIAWWVAS